MPPERRRLVVLLAILAAVSIVAIYRYWPETARGAIARTASRGGGRNTAPAGITAPDVHLQSLHEDRPRPVEQTQRDLFRFKPKAPPAPPPVARREPAAPVDAAPPGPPPLAPIPMRFIGLVEANDHAKKIAILSDGQGIYKGQEGDIIEGRYRILRIGVESVEMAYLDGRGRQTIRLSGS